MSTVCSGTFAVSDVPLAARPLDEIPFSHAVAELIDGQRGSSHRFGRREGIGELDDGIVRAQRILADAQRELAEPLPSWMEDNRRAGSPEEAEAELERRRKRVQSIEQILTAVEIRRAKRIEEVSALPPMPAGLEACSRYHGRLVTNIDFHPFLAALHRAFCDHRPASISPDMIWLLIIQGAANHINANAETLRSRFVQHPGQLKLVVRRDDFSKGSPENPWAEVFPEFTRQIRSHVGDETHDFFVPAFSTTGTAEKAAFEITFMDAMQSYFRYELQTKCGIPSITLEGTVEDWERVARGAQMLSRFDLNWWLPILEPILRQFVQAAEGRPEREFWRSIYKYHSGSGGNSVTGWITAFFPYFKDRDTGRATRLNPFLTAPQTLLERQLYPAAEAGDLIYGGPGIDEFPTGLARAPLLWVYLSREIKMELLAGFVGVAQDAESLCLRPEIGWAVRETPRGKTK